MRNEKQNHGKTKFLSLTCHEKKEKKQKKNRLKTKTLQEKKVRERHGKTMSRRKSANEKIGKIGESKMDMIDEHKNDERTESEMKTHEKKKKPFFSSNEAIDGINVSDLTM